MRKPMTRLTVSQQFKLADWLRSNEQRLLDDQFTYIEAAKVANKELGFNGTKINDKHVTTVAKALELRWKGNIGGNHRSGGNAKIGRQNADRIRVLSGLVANLYIELGIPVPDVLRAVMYNKKMPTDLDHVEEE